MNFFNVTLAGLLASTLLAGGCASPSGRADLATWQTRLEEHVARTGHGDLNVLRVADPASPVPMFNVLGGAEPEDSIDHAGLLLGKRAAADRTWYFFLVATIEARQINAIRLVAVSARPAFDSGASTPGDDGRAIDRGLDWRVGPADPHAFALYRQSIARFVTSPDPLARWTSGVDRFDLAGTGPQWRATHTPSGAAWTVDAATSTAQSSPMASPAPGAAAAAGAMFQGTGRKRGHQR
jgi:hypothetical protein